MNKTTTKKPATAPRARLATWMAPIAVDIGKIADQVYALRARAAHLGAPDAAVERLSQAFEVLRDAQEESLTLVPGKTEVVL